MALLMRSVLDLHAGHGTLRRAALQRSSSHLLRPSCRALAYFAGSFPSAFAPGVPSSVVLTCVKVDHGGRRRTDDDSHRQFSTSLTAAPSCSSVLPRQHVSALRGSDRAPSRHFGGLSRSRDRLDLTRRSFGSSSGSGSQSPYDILGVSRSASDKEIKLAYYKLAKQHHPDLHQTASEEEQRRCKLKFQQLSAAFDAIKSQEDRDKHAQAESAGAGAGSEAWRWDGSSGSSSAQQQQQTNSSYEDLFNGVMRDKDVVKEAMQSVVTDLQEELLFAVECGQRGDWKTVGMVLKEHSLVVGGIIVPLVLFVRFPFLIAIVVKTAVNVSTQALRFMLQNPSNFAAGSVAAGLLWERMVQISRMQRVRSQRRAEVRAAHTRRAEAEAKEAEARAAEDVQRRNESGASGGRGGHEDDDDDDKGGAGGRSGSSRGSGGSGRRYRWKSRQ